MSEDCQYWEMVLQGVYNYSLTCGGFPRGRKWEKTELLCLEKYYSVTEREELSRIFGRTAAAIYKKAFSLGFTKNEEFIAKSRFQKGYTPFNKGKRMEEWLSPRVHSLIKKNQKRTADRNRATAYPDGTERKRHNGYYLKQSGKWVRRAVMVWERENGVVPHGYVVVHRSCKFDDSIRNLYIAKKCNAGDVLKGKGQDVRRQIRLRGAETRRRNSNHLISELRKAQNSLNYVPKI